MGITAATPYIMGFTPELRAAAGKQFVDVGIAEEHAVTFATALARSGAKPVFGVYGTFLQRAYDELWHDLCLNDAPATILVFGASIFGTTSETHLSFFDISMLGGLPNMHYLAPACMEEYLSMLSWSLDHREHPVAIRVPGKYKIAGKPFGSKEPYGIGLPLDSDGVAFVNDFLKKIEDDGTWTELWQICIGDRTGDTNVPELPEIGA